MSVCALCIHGFTNISVHCGERMLKKNSTHSRKGEVKHLDPLRAALATEAAPGGFPGLIQWANSVRLEREAAAATQSVQWFEPARAKA